MTRKRKTLFTRSEMLKMTIDTLKSRGVQVQDISDIAFKQQSKFSDGVTMEMCNDSVLKILSLRDIFHHVLLASEIDRLVEAEQFLQPLQDILHEDLGLFGIDETMGLDIAGLFGTIGQTNFGDIDVNKTGIVNVLNSLGDQEGVCHTFLDDVVGAIAAAASTRVAQLINEEAAHEDPEVTRLSIFDIEA